MTEFVTYVLYSKEFDKIYIGYSGNLIERMQSHNYFSRSGYTKKYRPWTSDIDFGILQNKFFIRTVFSSNIVLNESAAMQF